MTIKEAIRVIEAIIFCANATTESCLMSGDCDHCKGNVDQEKEFEAYKTAIEALEKREALTKELKDMKRKAYSFLNQDYATGYISAISTIEGFMSE